MDKLDELRAKVKRRFDHFKKAIDMDMPEVVIKFNAGVLVEAIKELEEAAIANKSLNH